MFIVMLCYLETFFVCCVDMFSSSAYITQKIPFNAKKIVGNFAVDVNCSTRTEKAGRRNGQSAVAPMCDAENDWHERSFRVSGAKNFLSTNRKSNFLSLYLSHQWRIYRSLFDFIDPKYNKFLSVVMMLKFQCQ